MIVKKKSLKKVLAMSDELFLKRAAEEDGCMISAIGLQPLHAKRADDYRAARGICQREDELIRKIQIFDGEWHRVHSHTGCCDCGLVHRIEYRGIIVRGKHYLVFRCTRLTAEARNKEKYPFARREGR